MRKLALLAAGLAVTSVATPALANKPTPTVEDPGVMVTTGTLNGNPVTFNYMGMETFNGRDVNSNSFTTNFRTEVPGFSVNENISARYSGVKLHKIDEWAGSSNASDELYAYAGRVSTESSYSVKFESSDKLNYFGFFMAALDPWNKLIFRLGETEVATYTAAELSAFVTDAYKGNPIGKTNPNEPYAFLNFYLGNTSFDEVVFFHGPNSNGAGFESDNHTVGYYKPVGAVPEPATWAMLILGFGVIGSAMRTRRRSTKVNYSFG